MTQFVIAWRVAYDARVLTAGQRQLAVSLSYVSIVGTLVHTAKERWKAFELRLKGP